MKGVFISYRREDSAPYAGRIFDYLRRAFPSTSIFMDVGAIKPGADFVKDIDSNLFGSGVVLAVIGPHWQTAQDSQGRRRLEDPDDFVVRELATALERKAQVIPLLVGGARMPPADSLPPALSELPRRNAIEVDDARFDEDAERICQVIESVLGIPRDEEQARKRKEYGRFFSDSELASARRRFRNLVWTGYGLLLLTWLLSPESLAMLRSSDVSQAAGNPEILQYDCSAPEIKTDEQYTACRALNAMNATIARADTNKGWFRAVAIALSALLFLFLAWVVVKLLRGRKWARIVYAVLAGAMLLPVFDVLSAPMNGVLGIALVVVYLAMLVACLWATRMMFTDPIRRWFVRLE